MLVEHIEPLHDDELNDLYMNAVHIPRREWCPCLQRRRITDMSTLLGAVGMTPDSTIATIFEDLLLVCKRLRETNAHYAREFLATTCYDPRTGHLVNVLLENALYDQVENTFPRSAGGLQFLLGFNAKFTIVPINDSHTKYSVVATNTETILRINRQSSVVDMPPARLYRRLISATLIARCFKDHRMPRPMTTERVVCLALFGET